MGKGSDSDEEFPRVDPERLLEQQERRNRVNTFTPYGSQVYGEDDEGRATFTTSLSPAMQRIMDRQERLATTDAQRYNPGADWGGLVQALMNRNTQRYGQTPALSRYGGGG